MTKLKPCPFCGGEVNVHSSSDAFSSPFFEIYCPQCYTSMRYYINVLETDEHNKEGIVQRWNTRASDWHTGTPTEGGLYFVYDKYAGYGKRELPEDIEAKDLKLVFTHIVAWQKIEPYKEKEDGKNHRDL